MKKKSQNIINEQPVKPNEETKISLPAYGLKDIRKAYLSDGVYFYTCHKCKGYHMLHLEKCFFCNTENAYYD
jgi:hypothetical protein